MSYNYRQGSGTSVSQPSSSGRSSYPPVAQPIGGGYGNDGSNALYPRVAQPSGSSVRAPPPIQISNSGTGTAAIRVAIKPEYRIAPAFQFDFDVERRILADAEHAATWRPHDHLQEFSANANGRPSSSSSASREQGGGGAGAGEDAVTSKYTSMGLHREAVTLALANYGDVQDKVLDFCSSYTLLREMGFAPEAISGALAKYDNNREEALAYLAP
eukprot:jgi/Mesen1/3100/ME000184S02166